MEKILDYVSQLYINFGWYFLAIVAFVTLIMIPINLLVKKLFSKSKSTQMSRLCKTITQVMVFVMSGVSITIFSLIFKHKFNFEFVLINLVPTGVCAMVLWTLIKFARDLGFRDLCVYLANNAEVKKLLSKVKLDHSVKTAIYDSLLELVNNTDGDNKDIVIAKADEIRTRATQMLQGFVEQPTQLAEQFVEILQKKFIKKGDK